MIAFVLASLPAPAVQIIPTASPFVATPAASEVVIARFIGGDAICGGAVHRPRLSEEPLPAGFSRFAGSGSVRPEPRSFALSFDIDASGRPTNIRDAAGLGGLYLIDARDIAPTFSSWRFRPGARRAECRILFDVRAQRVHGDALLARSEEGYDVRSAHHVTCRSVESHADPSGFGSHRPSRINALF